MHVPNPSLLMLVIWVAFNGDLQSDKDGKQIGRSQINMKSSYSETDIRFNSLVSSLLPAMVHQQLNLPGLNNQTFFSLRMSLSTYLFC